MATAGARGPTTSDGWLPRVFCLVSVGTGWNPPRSPAFSLATVRSREKSPRAMPDDDASSESAPHWRWLDRWFESPGRALLSWMALAMLSGWAAGRAVGSYNQLLGFMMDHAS